MELILWRHGDAEDGLVDEERKLTNKGAKQVARIAAWLKVQLPDEFVILVSPAARAQETAQALTRSFETTPAVGPAASPQSLLEAAGWPNRRGTVVVVGHQPTLGHTAAFLMTGKHAEWSVKKGAIWWFEQREREGRKSVLLRAVLGPDQL